MKRANRVNGPTFLRSGTSIAVTELLFPEVSQNSSIRVHFWQKWIKIVLCEETILILQGYRADKKEAGKPNLLTLPPPRIELGTEHYHCSIIPFNYSGDYLSILPWKWQCGKKNILTHTNSSAIFQKPFKYAIMLKISKGKRIPCLTNKNF